MGELIHFHAYGGVERSKPAQSESHGATIVFFTGVRYQRHEPAASPEPDAGSNSPPKGGMDGAGGGKRRRRG